MDDEQERSGKGLRGRAADVLTRRDPDGPPLPAVALRGVAATFLVAIVVAAATVGAFTWVDGATPHLVADDRMSGAVERGDVAIVRPETETTPGALVRWTDEAGTSHLHRLHALDGEVARLAADTHGTAVATAPLDRVDGVAERRVPMLGFPLLWLREGAVGNVIGFAALVAASVGTLIAVPLRAGVVGEREAPRRDPTTDPEWVRVAVDDYFEPATPAPPRAQRHRRTGRRRTAA